MGLFGKSREWQSGLSKLQSHHNQVGETKERNIISWRRRKLGRVLEEKSLGERQGDGEFSPAELQSSYKKSGDEPPASPVGPGIGESLLLGIAMWGL